VSPDDFTAQMDWLMVNRYHPVDFNDMRAYFAGTTPLPSRPVVITFDDGYADLYTTAYPILAAHHFKAVAYIVSSFVGQSRYVTKEQVLEMDRKGIQIASAHGRPSQPFSSIFRVDDVSARRIEALARAAGRSSRG